MVDFSYDFKFGRSYLLNEPLGNGAWALNLIISGSLPQQQGTVSIDGNILDLASRRNISWLVRRDEIMRFGIFTQSVKSQIERGLKSKKQTLLKSHQEIRDTFRLTLGRYGRKLRQFSSEGWSASCAVGFANGRKIFCYPHMGYSSAYIIKEQRYNWFEDELNFLKSTGALVLLPAMLSEYTEGLCDEVVSLK